MKLFDFKYVDDNGKELNLQPSEGVTIIDENGERITIRGRRTDGEIEIYCDRVLIVKPRAANLVYVKAVKS